AGQRGERRGDQQTAEVRQLQDRAGTAHRSSGRDEHTRAAFTRPCRLRSAPSLRRDQVRVDEAYHGGVDAEIVDQPAVRALGLNDVRVEVAQHHLGRFVAAGDARVELRL